MKVKVACGAALAFAIGSNLLTVSVAAAFPAYGQEISFYSDASKTVEVGNKTVMCNGLTTNEGQETPYWTVTSQWWCNNTKDPGFQ